MEVYAEKHQEFMALGPQLMTVKSSVMVTNCLHEVLGGFAEERLHEGIEEAALSETCSLVHIYWAVSQFRS